MEARTDIRISGAGGQGVILSGIILAEASAIYDGTNAVQTQAYGPEARGGASRSEVIISEEKVNYPKVIKADILVALTQEAYDKYSSDLKSGGTLIIDSVINQEAELEGEICDLPLLEVTKEKLGTKRVANIVALGILARVTSVVSIEALKNVIPKRVPEDTEEINLQALKLGQRLVEDRQL